MVLCCVAYRGGGWFGSVKGLDLSIGERRLQITTYHCHETLR